MPNEFEQWLNSLPQKAGDYNISTPRRFAHEEDNYDAQYHNEPLNLEVGQNAVQLFQEHGGDFSAPALEIGCGTGLMSLGLVQSGQFGRVLLTDPSPKFLDITRKKLSRAGIPADKVAFGVLMGEELSLLPTNAFSAVYLRSVLHHVIDVPKFVDDAAKALKPGGMMIMEEPCQEGMVVMASIAQFFPLVMKQLGKPLSSAHATRLQLFLDTMKFYTRRDIDKSKGEDKHAFQIYEMVKMAENSGLRLEFFPNRTFYDRVPPVGHSFTKFFRDYLKYAMAFDEEFIKLFDAHFATYCKWVEELAVKGNGPYMHGVFIFKKL